MCILIHTTCTKIYYPAEATTTPVTPEAENTTEMVTETDTSGASVDESSSGSDIASMCGHDCAYAIYMLSCTLH